MGAAVEGDVGDGVGVAGQEGAVAEVVVEEREDLDRGRVAGDGFGLVGAPRPAP
jgi:hypothetical protein